MKLKSFECNHCGGELQFHPEQRMLQCSYCGWRYPLGSKLTIQEYGLNGILCRQQAGEGNRVSSGGWASPVPPPPVPEGLLPFAVSEQEARKLFDEAVRGSWFTPREIARRAQFHRLYLPYREYSISAYAQYSCQIRMERIVQEQRLFEGTQGKPIPEMVEKKEFTWKEHQDSSHFTFRGVSVPALNALRPRFGFDFDQAIPLMPASIPDAEVIPPAFDAMEGFDKLCPLIEKRIARRFKKEIPAEHYDRFQLKDPRYLSVSYRTIYAPVWAVTYFWKGEEHFSLIQGQNGELSELPLRSSHRMIGFSVAAAVAGVSIFCLLGAVFS